MFFKTHDHILNLIKINVAGKRLEFLKTNQLSCMKLAIIGWIQEAVGLYVKFNKHLAIGHRLRVSCAHNMLRASIDINN